MLWVCRRYYSGLMIEDHLRIQQTCGAPRAPDLAMGQLIRD